MERPQHVLLVTDHLPRRTIGLEASGHARYLEQFIEYFCGRGAELTIVLLRPRLNALGLVRDALPFRLASPQLTTVGRRYVVSAPLAALTTVAYAVFRRLPLRAQQPIAALRARLRKKRGFCHVIGRYLHANERRFVAGVARDVRPDVVLFDSIFNVCGRFGDAEHWVITQDVKFERAASFAAQGLAVLPRAFDPAFEREVLRSVGNVIAIQWSEAATFRAFVPEARVVTVPVALDLPAAARHTEGVRGRCVFVASATFTNVDGLRWFLAQCWPAIRAGDPGAHLELYGSVCSVISQPPPGVRLNGFVPDIGDAYASATLAIVPLQIGSGLKVKLVEALAYGLPVVTTSVGAQGLEALEPAPFRIVDDPRSFSAAVLEVLGTPDLQLRLAREARLGSDALPPGSRIRRIRRGGCTCVRASGSGSRSRRSVDRPHSPNCSAHSRSSAWKHARASPK